VAIDRRHWHVTKTQLAANHGGRLDGGERVSLSYPGMSRLLLLALIACGSAPPAAKPTPPKPDPLAAMLGQLDEALKARPDDQVLLLLRAAYTSEAKRVAEAIAFVEKLDATGWDVPFSPSDFKALHADPRFQELAARIAARAPKVHVSEPAFTIPGADFIPEGIAIDPSGTFYVGSIRKRTILAFDRDGKSRTFVPAARDGLSSVLGIKVDAARGVLWATSFASDSMEGYDPKTDKNRSELTAFALADGTTKRRIAFPTGEDPHLLNDLAIAADGTIYVTDSNAGAVWRVPADRDVFEPLVEPGSLAYPNGLVLAGTKLLVAHGTGIAIVDPTTGAFERMTAKPNVPLGGIDGLLLEGTTLIAVQNGLGVPRIVAIELAGTTPTSLRVLENDPALEILTTAALFEGALYTVADAQLDAFGPDGLKPDRKLRESRIVRTRR
jgi:sugar lactone lactonase YvrE